MTTQAADAPGSPLQALIDKVPIAEVQVRVVLLCALVTLVEGIDLTLIPLLAPAIAKAWSIPSSAFGAIFSAGPIGLIVGGFGVGWFADRLGRRAALLGAMVIMTLSTVVSAWAGDPTQLMICRVLTGIGFGGVVPAATSLVSEFLPSRTRASVVAFVILGQSFGALLAALFMKTSLASSPWQTIILEVSGLCALITLVLWAALPESPRYLLLRAPDSARLKATLRRLRIAETPAVPIEPAGGRAQVRELFGHGRALGTGLLWATFVGTCATVSFFTTWLTLIYTYAGKPAADGVSAMAAYSFGGIVGGLAIPPFSARWNVNLVLMATILAGAASCAVLGSVLHLGDAVNLGAAFACGVFVPGAFYLLYPPAVRFYPTAIRSTGIGSAVAVGRIGNTLSPLAAGYMLSAGFGAPAVFWAMALPMAGSFLALLLFHRLTGGAEAADAAH
jgi:AAHS family 4-hydroxybenzoate transporter-like MFS transporter